MLSHNNIFCYDKYSFLIKFMQNIYQTFEFSKILELVSEFAKSEKGKEDILALTMLESKEVVKRALDELEEMMSLISRFSYLPISTSANMIKIIEIAKKTAMLTPRDLSLIREDILTSRKILTYFEKVGDSYPLIKEYLLEISDLSSLESEIRRVITPSLTVSDNATPELKEIRRKLKTLEANLNSRVASISLSYSSYLSDNNVTIRDGHFVLPVKTVYKSKVLGIVYDVSSSGNTTFIEPLEIVQLNNDIASLKVQENDEVRKILKVLTSLVLLQEDEVRKNNLVISKLDFISAKAIFALDNDMHIAKSSDKQEIHLYEARHPLIDKRKVVSNEYHLDEEHNIVIISGPNAGGKTVSIKVVGLLTLMNQAGLAIPVKEGTLGYFNHIYIDIGDNQSLSDNLSTFSAHMSQIGEIMDVVKAKDLVLLDELGTGTDPKEGEALALATIKYLEKKRPLCLISSHFGGVKEYAFLSTNLENSSLLFDESTFSPTYIYKYSVPGKSYGLEVAKRYGVKDEIIQEAKAILANQSDSSINELITILQRKLEETEKLKRELDQKEKELAREQKNLESNKEQLKEQRSHLLESVKEEKEQILSSVKEEISDILRQLNNPNITMHEVVELKHKVESLEDEVEEITFNEDIQVNDYVSIPSINLEGKVQRIKGNKAHILTSDGLSFDADVNKLHKIDAPKQSFTPKSKGKYEDKINTSVGLELNIIGMRRDEAKNALIKYLDNCMLKHLKTVRIIHGFGNGILRNMVHEYLNGMKGVSYRLGDINEGGGGATVVTFND